MADTPDLLLSENSPAAGLAADSGPNTAATDAKIEKDLAVVEEKMDLCNSMINPGEGLPQPSIQHDETVRAVIGFLEACAPRLVELISADEGVLGPSSLERCFSVQERLTKLLEQVETLALTETGASTTAAAPAAASSGSDLLLDMDSVPAQPPAPPANAKTTGEEDPFGNTVGGSSEASPLGKAKSDDDFDDFFATRQQQS
eukprot:CAMPEP_0172452196 /NCGR_PEP_ID=MMETSP1065-20121228/9931_1 /TAXON_ID=265537 /ORGANISM="Amphiprora paludosa, Strain CCMP125" /LENGTH=201 /DNA_ID=CAMNT_0013204225 /DNA_START=62 /DNA_END=667 /DNA_ORIENTATION=+